MKKMFLSILAVLMAGGIYLAAETDKGAPLRKGGGEMDNLSTIQLGSFPSSKSAITIPCTAYVALTAGDAVILASDTTYPVSVSKTSSAGEDAFFGIAMATAAANEEVEVAICGIVKARTGAEVSKGAVFTTSDSAGLLTPVSGVLTEAELTPLSTTALVGEAIATKASTGATMDFLIKIGR